VASRKALGWCQACPIAVFFVLHFVEVVELADSLIHGIACLYYTGAKLTGRRLNWRSEELFRFDQNAGVLRFAQNDKRCG
jgi:hypothetical protein